MECLLLPCTTSVAFELHRSALLCFLVEDGVNIYIFSPPSGSPKKITTISLGYASFSSFMFSLGKTTKTLQNKTRIEVLTLNIFWNY